MPTGKGKLLTRFATPPSKAAYPAHRSHENTSRSKKARHSRRNRRRQFGSAGTAEPTPTTSTTTPATAPTKTKSKSTRQMQTPSSHGNGQEAHSSPRPKSNPGRKTSSGEDRRASQSPKRSPAKDIGKGLTPPDPNDFDARMQSAIKQAVQGADSARPQAAGASPAVSPATTTPEDFDRTQWENTRWKDECMQSSGGNAGTPAQTPNAETRVAEPTTRLLHEGTNIPGEELQEKEEHGQHLVAFPRASVWMCIAEVILLVICLILVSVARDWRACTILSVCALGLDICIVGPTLALLWTSKHVAQLVRNGHTAHYVARKYKLGFTVGHFLRVSVSTSTLPVLVLCAVNSDKTAFFASSAVLVFLQTAIALTQLVFAVKRRFAVRHIFE